MLNLVSQYKHHARKHTAILQVMTTWRSYIFATFPKVAHYHINPFGYIHTYTFMEYTREYSVCSRSCRQKLGKHSLSFLQDIKNGISNPYFVKIQIFRLQTSKLLGNRRKTYILDVICNRCYCGNVQEEVLGQCCEQGISISRTEGVSSISCLFQKKNKMRGWGNALCKYSTEVSRFVLEILEKSKVIASMTP